MKKTYSITGMTCSSCETKVKKSLLEISNIENVTVSKENQEITIYSKASIPISVLQNSLNSKYNILSLNNDKREVVSIWLDTYKPVLLIFVFITTTTLLIEYNLGKFEILRWMRNFMAGFFLVFSFFKMLNLSGFKNSYQMYDIVAKKFPFWGLFYPFLELTLGVAYLIDFNSFITNSVTFSVMFISIIGVLKSVLNKKKFNVLV